MGKQQPRNATAGIYLGGKRVFCRWIVLQVLEQISKLRTKVPTDAPSSSEELQFSSQKGEGNLVDVLKRNEKVQYTLCHLLVAFIYMFK